MIVDKPNNNQPCSFCGDIQQRDVTSPNYYGWQAFTSQGKWKICCPRCNGFDRATYPCQPIHEWLLTIPGCQWKTLHLNHPRYGNGYVIETNKPMMVLEKLIVRLHLKQVERQDRCDQIDQDKEFFMLIPYTNSWVPLKIRPLPMVDPINQAVAPVFTSPIQKKKLTGFSVLERSITALTTGFLFLSKQNVPIPLTEEYRKKIGCDCLKLLDVVSTNPDYMYMLETDFLEDCKTIIIELEKQDGEKP